MDTDAELMRRALALAATARRRTPPNPWVGCLLVRDGEVVGEGATQPPGGPHAEVEALRAAGRPGTRRHRLRHARALLAPRPHASVRRRADRRGRGPGRRRHRGPGPQRARAGHRAPARTRRHRRRRRGSRGGVTPPRPVPRASRARALVRRTEDGDQPRRSERRARRFVTLDHRTLGARRRARAARRLAGGDRRSRDRARRPTEPHRARHA